MNDSNLFTSGWEISLLSKLEGQIGLKLGFSYEDIKSWCARVGEIAQNRCAGGQFKLMTTQELKMEYEVLVDPSVLLKPAPIWVGKPSPFFSKSAQVSKEVIINTPQLNRYHLKNVSVFQLGELGAVFVVNDNVIVSDLSTPFVTLLDFVEFDLSVFLTKDTSRGDKGLCLFDRFWEPNYAHWLLDLIPRGIGFEKSKIDKLVTKIRSSWQSSLLDLYGHVENKVSMEPGVVYSYNELYVCGDSGGKVHHPSVKSSRPIIKYLGEYPTTSKENNLQRKNVLLVVRRDNRKLKNIDQLLDMLLSIGYSVSVIDPSVLSVKEQMESFFNHSIVIATHGAALASSVFMRDRSTLIEFLPSTYCNPAFWQVSSSVNVRYIGVTGLEDSLDGETRPRLKDFFVTEQALFELHGILSGG